MEKENKNQSVEMVKIVVTKPFRDKLDHTTYYEVGQELAFDKERADDVIGRELAELQVEEG